MPDRTGQLRPGQGTELQGQTVHGGRFLAHQAQLYRAGVVGFVGQGQALGGQPGRAAVIVQSRHRAVGGGQIHGQAVGQNLHIPGGIFGPGKLVMDSVGSHKAGQVVPAGLHGPDLVPLGAEGLFAVGLHPHVDEQRLAVLVEGYAAGVVVVVAVGVAAGLEPCHKGTGPADPQSHAGVPHVGGDAGVCGVVAAYLRLGKGGLDVVEQVDAFRVVGCRKMVGVRIGGKIGGGQGHQRRAAHPLAEQVLPHTPGTGQRTAIGKIQIVPACHMHLGNVIGQVADLGLLPHIVQQTGGQGTENFQGVEKGQCRVAVVLGSLAAAAVLAVILQEAVHAVGSPLHTGPHPFGAAGMQQCQGDQTVLGAPGGPVAHGFVPVAHPPEVTRLPGMQDAAVYLPHQAGVQPGKGLFQRGAQQIVHHGQQCAGLGGEQVHDGAGGIRQGQLRGVPDVAVVGGQLPGALLAQGPHQIGNFGQVFPGIAHALGHDQPAEQPTACEIGMFVPGPVAGLGKVQPQVQWQRRNLPGGTGSLAPAVQPTVKAGQGVPGGAVPHRGTGNPASRCKVGTGGNPFSQHRWHPPWYRYRPAVCAGRCGD